MLQIIILSKHIKIKKRVEDIKQTTIVPGGIIAQDDRHIFNELKRHPWTTQYVKADTKTTLDFTKIQWYGLCKAGTRASQQRSLKEKDTQIRKPLNSD